MAEVLETKEVRQWRHAGVRARDAAKMGSGANRNRRAAQRPPVRLPWLDRQCPALP